MACSLCGAADHRKVPLPNLHPVLDCPTYAKVPQPLKDAIKRLWERNPQKVARGSPLATWIYENIYSPGAANTGGFWEFYFNPGYVTEERIVASIEERIYLSVKTTSLLRVWDNIQPLFQGVGRFDVIQAKHCLEALADTRPDSIVVYLRNKAAVWRFCDGLRSLRHQGAIKDTDFKETPVGAGRIGDLPGVATAPQPADPSQSFGDLLSAILAEAFDQYNRPVRIPILEFTTRALVKLKNAGQDITKPWIRPVQVF
jgi:hypothetical protein